MMARKRNNFNIHLVKLIVVKKKISRENLRKLKVHTSSSFLFHELNLHFSIVLVYWLFKKKH